MFGIRDAKKDKWREELATDLTYSIEPSMNPYKHAEIAIDKSPDRESHNIVPLIEVAAPLMQDAFDERPAGAIRIITNASFSSTYDHRSVKPGHPVRSAIHKH